jgi:peptidyl-prolyl cis-trans isomerase C
MTGAVRSPQGAVLIIALACGSACAREPQPTPAASAPTPLAGGAEAPEAPLPSPLPELVALVNGQAIGLRGVRLIAEQNLESGVFPPQQKPQAYRAALQQLIVRELLFAEAMARRVVPDAARIEAAYNEARVAYKDDASWEAFLRTKQLTPQTFREELRIKHTVDVLMEQEAAQAPSVSEHEARAFYDANPASFESGERLRAAHILLRVPADAAPSLKQARLRKAREILGQARAGKDFGALAKAHSEDVGSAGKGGILDAFRRGQLAQSFEEAAFSLAAGQLSDVVETPFGFHVIKLLDRLPSEKLTFEQAKAELMKRLNEQRQQARVQDLVERLRARARIQTFL